jgi:hypothetical protein
VTAPGTNHPGAAHHQSQANTPRLRSTHDVLSSSQLADEIDAMNKRIELRRARVADAPTIPISGPRWSDRVLDTGGELVAIHKDTAQPYPIRLMELDPGAAALVIVRRILDTGGSTTEARRFLGAFELDEHDCRRLSRQLDEGGL